MSDVKVIDTTQEGTNEVTEEVKVPRFTALKGDHKIKPISDCDAFSGIAFIEQTDWIIVDNHDIKNRGISGVGSTIRLNEQNTYPQNKFIRAKYKDDNEYVVVDHDVHCSELPMPPRVKFILEKLNA